MKHPSYAGRALGFAALAAVSLVFWWRPLAMTLGLALERDAYTHILLILPLSAGLIYVGAKCGGGKALRIEDQPSFKGGAVLLALALLMGGYARWGMGRATGDVRVWLGMFALVTWWIGSVVFWFGWRMLRAFALPLCFLFLLAPVPEGVLNALVRWLQYGSAWTATLLFRAVGEPVQRSGIFVSLAQLNIEVAEECSSIRSSCLLAITTIVLAQLFLRSWWRKALLIAAAIPLSVAKNGLRIFTIAELGTRVDPGFLNGRLHHEGGIVFLGIAVAAVVAMLWALRRTELPISRVSYVSEQSRHSSKIE
ncbi:MAG: exosortase/archaeosortase family protein [Terriglobales bacterium]|jgi:exosortase